MVDSKSVMSPGRTLSPNGSPRGSRSRVAQQIHVTGGGINVIAAHIVQRRVVPQFEYPKYGQPLDT